MVQVFGVRPPFWQRIVNGLRRRLGAAPEVVAAGAGVVTPASPWSHIRSFTHTEAGLRAQFRRAGFAVERAVTLATEHGQTNRVYFLRRAGAATGRA